MKIEYIALGISLFLLLFAAISLCWDVYRGIILKAKVRVSFATVTIFHATLPEKTKISKSQSDKLWSWAVNISGMYAKDKHPWYRFNKKGPKRSLCKIQKAL